MAKTRYVRTPDSNQIPEDVNLKVSGVFYLPVDSTDEPEAPGAARMNNGKPEFFDGDDWLAPSDPSNIEQDATHRFVSDTEKAYWNAKEPAISAGSSGQYWAFNKAWRTFNTDVQSFADTRYYTKTQTDGLIADTIKPPQPIDCSANPNYPTAARGDSFKVSVAGRIGGASGALVEVGDLLIATSATSAGDQATVGANWGLYQTNIDKSSEAVFGTSRRATSGEALSGTDDIAYMTSAKVKYYGDSVYVIQTRTINGYSLTGNITLSKTDIGLSAVPNVDATNPANISQSSTYRFVTDTEKTSWNGKQAALNGTGFVKISGTTISYDNNSYLQLSGGSLTGYLTMSGAPGSNGISWSHTGAQIYSDGIQGLNLLGGSATTVTGIDFRSNAGSKWGGLYFNATGGYVENPSAGKPLSWDHVGNVTVASVTIGHTGSSNQQLLVLPGGVDLQYMESETSNPYGFNIIPSLGNSYFLRAIEGANQQVLYFGDANAGSNMFGLANSLDIGATWTANFVVNGNGYVGINNANPTVALDVNGLIKGIQFEATLTTDNTYFLRTQDVDFDNVATSNSFRLRGRNNGNVGYIMFGNSSNLFGWNGSNLIYGADNILSSGNFSSYAATISPVFISVGLSNSVVNTTGLLNMMGSNGNGLIEKFNQASVRTFLGLGSNAYTSTSYLPLTGGTLSGALLGTTATFSGNVAVGGAAASTLSITGASTTGAGNGASVYLAGTFGGGLGNSIWQQISSTAMGWYQYVGSWSQTMTLDNGNLSVTGNIGSGVTPTYPLDIKGSVARIGNYVDYSSASTNTSTIDYLYIARSSGGNAGTSIGTSYDHRAIIMTKEAGQGSALDGSAILLRGLYTTVGSGGGYETLYPGGNVELYFKRPGATGGSGYTSPTKFIDGTTSVGTFSPFPPELGLIINSAGAAKFHSSIEALSTVILSSPNGTRWAISISNAGVLTTTSL